MKISKWSEVRAKGKGNTPEKMARVDREVRADLLAMDLRELRAKKGLPMEPAYFAKLMVFFGVLFVVGMIAARKERAERERARARRAQTRAA